MKAALISLGSKSSQMTAEAMKKYFESVDMIQLKDIEVRFGKEAGIFYEGRKFSQYDCVFVKGSFRYANLLSSIAMMLEGNVPYMPLSGSSFVIAHNKLLTHQVLQKKNIPMPRTYVSSTVDASKELLKRVHYPIVMKFPEGTQGKGVMFADSMSSASSLLDALGALNQPFIVQEYIETGGTDIRALVVGDKVVAAMKRVAQKEEKRSNIHAGGSGKPILISRELSKIAIEAAKAVGADLCGVDILQTALGPFVIEVNISPGLQGLSKVSTLDIPNEIAKFLYRKTEESLSKGRKKNANNVIKEIGLEQAGMPQQIITDLKFRGERILLPELVTKMTKFNDHKDYIIKAKKGKLVIQEFDI